MGRFPEDLLRKAERLLAEAKAAGVLLATAESCTGGLVAGVLTEIAGSSAAVDGGFVTYSNAAKTRLLGVPESLLAAHGAVSEPVARAMAEGALAHCDAAIAVSVTGIAGPGGGSAQKPVGLVHFACATVGGSTLAVAHRFGDLGRADVRTASVEVALDLLRAAVQAWPGPRLP